MRTFILLAALSVTAPTEAEEHAANTNWCRSATTPVEKRVTACSWLIEHGRLARVQQAEAFYSRGASYHEQNRLGRAIRDYDAAIALSSDFPAAYHARGQAYEAKKSFGQALRNYSSAIRLDPDFALALVSKAWLLATAPDDGIRDGFESVRMARRALQLVDFPAHHAALAAAYAEAGQFDKAVRAQELAIERLRASGRVLSIPEYLNRLDLYRAQRPYRR